MIAFRGFGRTSTGSSRTDPVDAIEDQSAFLTVSANPEGHRP